MRNFRELQIWKEAMEIVDLVFMLIDKFPKSELYGLSSQLSRSSISMPSNIAEGCSRSSEKDFKRYLEISIGSSFEAETQVEIAYRRKYISVLERDEVIVKLHLFQKKTN